MRTFILVLGLWATLEGGLSLLWPAATRRLLGLVSRKLSAWVASWPDRDLRKLGGLECLFGIWMLLLWGFTG